jgi:DNA-binding CsgD family transcriptional regulator
LSKAEAAVALEIAKGDGRGAAAKRLGLSQNTVRTHLSAIFDKLGIHRQAQLTRLVQSLSSAAE